MAPGHGVCAGDHVSSSFVEIGEVVADRSSRNTQTRGHLALVEAVDVVQPGGGAEVGGHAGEGALEIRANDATLRRGVGCAEGRYVSNERRSTSAVAHLVQA